MDNTGSMFVIYLLGIILGGIATLVCLIFAIISLANSKKNASIIWGVSFFISLAICILSIVSMIQGAVEKAKEGIKSMEEWSKENSYGQYNDYGSDNYNDDQTKSAWLDTLESYVRESMRPTVPSTFYDKNQEIKYNSDGTITAPFIYPYSVKFSKADYGVADIITEKNDSVFAENIFSFSFDENFVIAKVDNVNDKVLLDKGHAEIEYILFDMRTGFYETFKNEKQLFDAADRIGFVGSKYLRYLSSEYYPWIKEMEDYN